MGTQLTEIIRLSEVPVLAIAPDHVPAAISNILFATDFSNASIDAFRKILKVAEVFQATLQCVKINTPADFYTERLFKVSLEEFQQACSAIQASSSQCKIHYSLYNEKELVNGIVHAAEDYGADCLATATHGRRGFSLLMNGSVTEDLIRITHLPTLVVHLPPGEDD
jgi:nucleotide-binding universal stress UspA family protein